MGLLDQMGGRRDAGGGADQLDELLQQFLTVDASGAGGGGGGGGGPGARDAAELTFAPLPGQGGPSVAQHPRDRRPLGDAERSMAADSRWVVQ